MVDFYFDVNPVMIHTSYFIIFINKKEENNIVDKNALYFFCQLI